MSIVLSGQKYLCFHLYLYYFIFFNFQNVTYIQNVGFPTAVLGTAPVTAATRKFTVKGGASKYYLENRLFTIHMDYIIKMFHFFQISVKSGKTSTKDFVKLYFFIDTIQVILSNHRELVLVLYVLIHDPCIL